MPKAYFGESLYVSMYKAGPQVSFCTRDQELKVMQVSPLPIPEAVAVLTTIQPDLCAAAQGVVCVHAVCSGNSTMLPKLFHPDRVSSLAALFGGILANGVSTVGHGACPSAKFIVSLKRHSPMSFVRGDLRRRKDLCPCSELLWELVVLQDAPLLLRAPADVAGLTSVSFS